MANVARLQQVRSSKKRTELSSVRNAIRIVKAFTDDYDALGVSDLAARLRLAKSTVHRLAASLLTEGLLEQSAERGKYRLGVTLFELGSLVRRRMSVTDEAKAFLKQLAHTTGESLYLAILDQQTVLFVNIIESRRAIRINYKIGMRSPVHCTAAGKVLLAFESDDVIEHVIAGGLRAFTPSTITDPAAFRAEVAKVRASGYAVEREEAEIGLCAIAAPIRDDSGQVIAAIGLAGLAQRLNSKLLLSSKHDLIAAGTAVSKRLGYQNGARRSHERRRT